MSDSTIRNLLKAVETIRAVDATMPVQALAAFLAIAIYEGENVNSIATRVDMPQSSASRNISSLTAWDWRKKPGLKLVEYREDPMNLSQKTLYLTPKGKRLIETIQELLEKR